MKIISLKISLFFESIFFHTEKFSVNRKQQPRLEKMVKVRKAELIPRPWIYPRRFRYKSVWVIFPLQKNVPLNLVYSSDSKTESDQKKTFEKSCSISWKTLTQRPQSSSYPSCRKLRTLRFQNHNCSLVKVGSGYVIIHWGETVIHQIIPWLSKRKSKMRCKWNGFFPARWKVKTKNVKTKLDQLHTRRGLTRIYGEDKSL